MFKSGWKKLIILVLILIILAVPADILISSYQHTNTITPAQGKSKTVKNKSNTIPAVVEDTAQTNDSFPQNVIKFITCFGPDGKTSQATKEDCDNLISFWNTHKPANPTANSSSITTSTSTVSGTTSVSSPIVVPTDVPVTPSMVIDQMATLPMSITDSIPAVCTSSSCENWLTTLIVDGKNFSPTSRVSLSANGITYSENSSYRFSPHDAQYTGGNGATQIITDFYNLPACTTYDVTVTDINNPLWTTLVSGYTSPCK